MKTTYALPVSSQLKPPPLPHELPPHLRRRAGKLKQKSRLKIARLRRSLVFHR
jgi:hypothetical protein